MGRRCSRPARAWRSSSTRSGRWAMGRATPLLAACEGGRLEHWMRPWGAQQGSWREGTHTTRALPQVPALPPKSRASSACTSRFRAVWRAAARHPTASLFPIGGARGGGSAPACSPQSCPPCAAGAPARPLFPVPQFIPCHTLAIPILGPATRGPLSSPNLSSSDVRSLSLPASAAERLHPPPKCSLSCRCI